MRLEHARRWLAGGVAALCACTALAAETFDVSAYEKQPYEIKGYVEGRGEWLRLDPDAKGYALQFPGMTAREATRSAAVAEITGLFRHDAFTFNATGRLTYLDDVRESTDDARFLEAYASWAPNAQTTLDLGKKALRWGKGYAWNPVGFLERPKDPLDPDLAREGYSIASGEFVRSFTDSPVTNLALTLVTLPVTSSMNETYGLPQHTNPAVKLYLLAADTDIDLVYAANGSRGQRYGADFSRNVTSNLEVHGEWARLTDVMQPALTPTGAVTTRTQDASSWLVGLRYLSEQETTVIVEAYHNGAGYTDEELTAYYTAVGDAVASGNAQRLAQLRQVGALSYTRPSPARNYGYLRVSQKDPFDWLYFTPAITVIGNVDDGSYTVIPELTYAGVENVELRLRLQANIGGNLSEYGEKPIRSRIEMRLRWFF
jgi:hypothetical protein